MNGVMGVIFASDNENKLNELTIHRTTASLPFCGRYRLIDFTLSNFVNSGITQIGIVTRSNYSSLMDHIRMGRDWDLNRKNGGLSVFPPFVLNSSREMYKGKIEAIYSIQGFIRRSPEEYVLLSNSNIAMNIDFDDVMAAHLAAKADVTMLVHYAKTTTSRRLVVEEEDGEVKDLYISVTPSSEDKLLGLNVYLIKKDLLLSLVEHEYARGHVDFEKDILMKQLGSIKMHPYCVERHAAIVDDVRTYYNESMKVLDPAVREELFYGDSIIYTKVKDSVPTLYKENACVKNSLIADGCEIDGLVENSILFRGVKVEKGAEVRNSIIMEDGKIMENGSVCYAITDKNVTVTAGRTISGYESYPVVIVKDKTV